MFTRTKVSNIKNQQPPVILKATAQRYHPYQVPDPQGSQYTLTEYARHHGVAAQGYSQAMPVGYTSQTFGYPPYPIPVPAAPVFRPPQPMPAKLPVARRKVAPVTPMAPPALGPSRNRRNFESSREEASSTEEGWAKLEADRRRIHPTFPLKRYAVISDPHGSANAMGQARPEQPNDSANALPEVSSARVGPFHSRLPPPNFAGTSNDEHTCPLCNIQFPNRASWEAHYKEHYQNLETTGVQCSRCGVRVVGRAAALQHRETPCGSNSLIKPRKRNI